MKKIYSIILILFLVGCLPSSKLETATVTSSPIPTHSAVPTSSQTAQATFTPASTTIVSHPIPTPSSTEHTEITFELLQSNNGCDLPCWWGIVPNQTSWSDASKFLKPFSHIYERQPPSEWSVFDVRSPISKEYSELGRVNVVLAARDGIVKEIEVNGFDKKSYHLSQFLYKYGIPTNILISTYSSDQGLPANKVPLTIALYYSHKGIMATYATDAATDADVIGEVIKGCLERSPTLFLWSPNEHNRSIEYILGWKKSGTPNMNIEEATDLDIQSFYEKFVNPDNKPCLETPTSLWPAQ